MSTHALVRVSDADPLGSIIDCFSIETLRLSGRGFHRFEHLPCHIECCSRRDTQTGHEAKKASARRTLRSATHVNQTHGAVIFQLRSGLSISSAAIYEHSLLLGAQPARGQWWRAQKYEARELRTPHVLIWSQTRCRCAIAPLVTRGSDACAAACCA
jgi:hypothetical protein